MAVGSDQHELLRNAGGVLENTGELVNWAQRSVQVAMAAPVWKPR
jgi:hypothetical protein